GTRHTRIAPRGVAARAQEKTAAGGPGFARDREVAELRKSAAAQTVALIARPDAGRRDLRAKGLEHRAHRRARQVPIDRVLLSAPNPGGDALSGVSAVDPFRHELAQLLWTRRDSHL